MSRVIGLAAQGVADSPGGAAASLECLIDLSQGRLMSAWMRMALGECHAIVRALVLYERDEADETWPILMHNQAQIIDSGSTDALIVMGVLKSRIALSRGDPLAARHCLALLEQVGEHRACRRMRCSVWIERARVATLEGRLQTADLALAQVQRYAGWDPAHLLFYANEVDTPTVARLRLAIARGQCSEAARELRAAIDDARGRGLLRRTLKLRLLHAMALDGSGLHDAAFEELTWALQLASLEGWRRTFLEEGAGLGALLQRWIRAFQMRIGALGIEAAFPGDLLRRFSVDQCHPAQAFYPSGEALTSRERQIVGLLVDGARIRALAPGLRLSEHTVKTHLRNIYRKLGAHGAAEAAAIARARGLLES